MKILSIASQNPYPPIDGGKISLFYPLKYLASNQFDVLVTYPCRKIDREIERFGVKAFPYKLDTLDSVWKVVKNIGRRCPFKMHKYHSFRYLEYILNIIREKKPDIIQIQGVHMAWYGVLIRNQLGLPVILREHNIEYELVRQFSKQSKFLIKALSAWQFRKTKNYESKLWEQFDKVVHITPYDLDIAVKANPLAKANSICVMDGFEFDGKLNVGSPEPYSLIFSANWRTPQNLYSAKWFINNIWPELVNTIPSLKLYLTGQAEGGLFKFLRLSKAELAKKKVYSLGFVENIDETVTSKQIFISPTIMGSGLRLKILHAFSLAMPVICTSLDAQSLPYLKNEENVMITDTPEEWAEAVELLIKNADKREKIAKNAKKLALEYYNWNRYIKEINEVYNGCIKRDLYRKN